MDCGLLQNNKAEYLDGKFRLITLYRDVVFMPVLTFCKLTFCMAIFHCLSTVLHSTGAVQHRYGRGCFSTSPNQYVFFRESFNQMKSFP